MNKKSNKNSKITGGSVSTVSLKFTAEEAERFEQMRSERGLNKTDFIKSVLFSEKVNIIECSSELLPKLAECAECMNEMLDLMKQKSISDIGINALLNSIKERQKALAFRMADIEADIAGIIDRITTEEERNNDL